MNMFGFAFGLKKEANGFLDSSRGKGFAQKPIGGSSLGFDENYEWFQNTHAQKGNKKNNASKSTKKKKKKKALMIC